MKLRDALAQAGVSQGSLAETLSVSQAAVSKWVREEKPIPEARVSPIEIALGMEEGSLERGGSVKVTFGFESAPTVLGFLVIATDLGGSPVERIGRVAEVAGVNPSEAEAWCHGHRRLPLRTAVKLAGHFWPGVNPGVFAYEAGREVPESEAVRSAISKARLSAGPKTFDALRESIEEAEREWQEDPTKALTFSVAWKALDDERNIPRALRDRMNAVKAKRDV